MLGVEPVFPGQRQAIGYAIQRARFRNVEIRVLDSAGDVTETISIDESKRKL
jgi:hypothetical protein